MASIIAIFAHTPSSIESIFDRLYFSKYICKYNINAPKK